MTNSEEFLRDRRLAIGGSDASSIFGWSNYNTPLSTYMQKITDKVSIVSKEKQAIFDRGHILEPFLKAMFERDFGFKVSEKEQTVHPEHDFIRGHFDGVIESENAIVEFKTADNSSNNKNKWGEQLSDDIPTQYLLQTHHYLLTADKYTKAYVPVLHINHFTLQTLTNLVKKYGVDLSIIDDIDISLKLFIVNRNPVIESKMIAKYVEFWNNHVLPRVPPTWTSCDDLLLLFPTSQDKEVVADDVTIAALRDMQAKQEEIKLLEAAIEQDKTLICGYLQDATKLIDAQGKKLATWASGTRNSFDTTSFKESYAELAKQFYKTTITRTFRTFN